MKTRLTLVDRLIPVGIGIAGALLLRCGPNPEPVDGGDSDVSSLDGGSPDANYDGGLPDGGDLDSGHDAGNDGGSLDTGYVDGGDVNLPPVARLKYDLDYSGNWIEIHEGDTVSKPHNYGIRWDACSSTDDKKIASMKIYIGDGVLYSSIPLPCNLLGDASGNQFSKSSAIFTVKDIDGAESSINFFFESI